ncbi:glycosyltransferase [Actinotalea sp. C106]|uniref:glycosyltransferase n=1 Tax=Actinotalea sp. C106 TaxID=2908644 RepID=UPI0020278425|nr:glycosyltransferase [Actinotalea sp. C106]
MPSTHRPPVVHVTWQRHAGRATEIAEALGGSPVHIFFPALTRRPLVPLRHLLSIAATSMALVRLRPRTVIVTNPPVFPGLVVAAYAAATGSRFLLDSHPSSFGVKGNVVSKRLLGVTRWLARRSAGVMVTVDHYVEMVESWGARGLVVHEAPPAWQLGPPERGARPRVLFVGVFSGDEPVHEVVEAARALPEVDVAITGDLNRRPAGLAEGAPENVEFVGFLGPRDYLDEVSRADVLVSLTTEPTSIMRSAYEAVYARRPLVVSDWPSLREVFPHAHHASNDAASIATEIRAALDDVPSVQESALRAQENRWQAQLVDLRAALRLTP